MYLKEAPNSRECEEGLLASIVIDNELASLCLSKLSEESFYYDYTRSIFKSIKSLHSRKLPIDLMTVINEFEKNNEPRTVTREKIVDIMNGFLTSAKYKYYLNVVKEKENLRRIINTCLTTITEAREENDSNEILTKLKRLETEALESFNYDEWIDNSFREKQTQIINHRKNPILTGIQFIDRLTKGLIPTETLYLAGEGGIGKTRLSIRILNFMSSKGHLCLFFSIETKDYNIQRKIIELNTPYNLEGIDDSYIDSLEGVKEFYEQLTKKNLIIDSEPNCTIGYIRSRVIEMSRIYNKTPVVFIDSFDHISSDILDTNQRDMTVSKALYAMTQELRCTTIIIHHKNKKNEFRGSAKIKDNCDYMLSLEKAEGYINMKWAKTRDIRGEYDFKSYLAHEKNGLVETLNIDNYLLKTQEQKAKEW